ncbi:MAG: hypothetical protein ACI9BH_002069 [Paracoccaceae bacterium]|jgi:hypothetical protein
MALDINRDTVIETMPRDGINIIDTDRYPLDQPDSDLLQQAIAQARAGLEKDGCARLSGFIRPEAQAALAFETTALSPRALHSCEEYTPYGSGPNDSFPEDHPQCRAHRTTSGSVTRDLIPTDGLIQQIYSNPHLIAFIAACLSAEEIYQFADPMRGLIINSMDEGNVLGWHFDANEFIVSLMTRRAEVGGMFEYCPGIRAPGHENFEDVKGVLDGKPDLIKNLDLQVGDLQLFKGRYSLHRVNQIEKGTRHTAIFGYALQPGFIGSVASTMKVYGRVMQEHIDAEHTRQTDGLAD